MKGQLILAEAATSHPDGTISMLRAGIDRLVAPALPVGFHGMLVVRIVGEIGDAGSHDVDLRCMNQDGKPVLPAVQGQFQVPQGGGITNLLFGLDLSFPEKGRMVWVLRVNRMPLDELPFSVEVQAPQGGKGG